MEQEYIAAAKDALFVQSASNLSGIIFTLHKALLAVNARRHELEKGTDWVNKHPILYLFSVQIGHLTGSSIIADGDYNKACDICEKISRGEEVEGW